MNQTAISIFLRGAVSAVNSCVGVIGSASTQIQALENGTTGTGNDLADHIDDGSLIVVGGSYAV